jgi:hypothetical protein
LNVTRHTSHVTRHTSHITRHTSHVTRHTSHVTRHLRLCIVRRPRRLRIVRSGHRTLSGRRHFRYKCWRLEDGMGCGANVARSKDVRRKKGGRSEGRCVCPWKGVEQHSASVLVLRRVRCSAKGLRPRGHWACDMSAACVGLV